MLNVGYKKKAIKILTCLALVNGAILSPLATSGIQKVSAAEKATTYVYTGDVQSFNAVYSGAYEIVANGSQGVNGGKGGSAKAKIDLEKGDTLNITVGGQQGKYGGGKGTNNGGDATTFKLNDNNTILIGAGGGGGSGATVGGSGNGKGGASVGATAGADGTNGGGGGRSEDYIKKSGYWYWTEPYTEKHCGPFSPVYDDKGNVVGQHADCWDVYFPSVEKYRETTTTVPGLFGTGGSNYFSNVVTQLESLIGVQSGTGIATVTLSNYFPILKSNLSESNSIEFGKPFEVDVSVSDPDSVNNSKLTLYYSEDGGKAIELGKAESSVSDTTFKGSISDLSIGEHTLKIWAIDDKAGKSNVTNLNVTVTDNIPPEIDVSNLEDGDFVIDRIIPNINVTDYSMPIDVAITLNGENYKQGTQITKKGENTLEITATDNVGNVANKILNFTINKTPVIIENIGVQSTLKKIEKDFDLTEYFNDAEDDTLSFTASSDKPETVKVTLDGDNLKLKALKQGSANISVIANDGHSDSAEMNFIVNVETRIPQLAVSEQDLIIVDNETDFELNGTIKDEDIEDVTVKGILNGIESTTVIPTTGKEDSWTLKWGSELAEGIYNDLSILAEDEFGGKAFYSHPNLVVKVVGSASIYNEIITKYATELGKPKNELTIIDHEVVLNAYYAMNKLETDNTPSNLKDAKTKVNLLEESTLKNDYLVMLTKKAWEYTTHNLSTVDVEVLAIAGFENVRIANEELYQSKGQLYKKDTISHTITDQFTKSDMQLLIESVNKLTDAQADTSLEKWLKVKEIAFETVLGDYQNELLSTVLTNALLIVKNDTTQISIDSLNDFFNITGQASNVDEYQDYLHDVIQTLNSDLTVLIIKETVLKVDALNDVFKEGIENPSKQAITDYLQVVSELVKGKYQTEKEKDQDKLKLAYLVTYPEKHDKEDFERLGLTITEDNITAYYPLLKEYVSEIGTSEFTFKDAQDVIVAVDASIKAISTPSDENIASMLEGIADVQNGDKLFSDYIKQLEDVLWDIAQNSPQDLTVPKLEQLFGNIIVPENLDEYKDNLKQYAEDKGETLSKEDIHLVIEATNAVVKAEKDMTMASVDEAKAIVDKLLDGILKDDLLDRLEQVVISIVTANASDITENLLKYLGIENVNPDFMDEYKNAISDYDITSKQDIQNVIDTVNAMMAAVKDWTVENISTLEKAKNNLRVSTFKTTINKFINVLKNYRNAMNTFDEKALNSANSAISSLPDSAYKVLLNPSQNALVKLLSAKNDLNKASKDDAKTAIEEMANSTVKDEMKTKWQELQLEYLNSNLNEADISNLLDLGIKNLNPAYEQDYLDALKQYAEDKGQPLTKEDIQLVIDVINAVNKANTMKDNTSVKEAQTIIKTLLEGKLKDSLSKEMNTLYNVLNPYIPTKDDWLKYVQKNPLIVTEADLTKADIENINKDYIDEYRMSLEKYTKDKGELLTRNEIQQIINTINLLKKALASQSTKDIKALQDALLQMAPGSLKDNWNKQLESLKESIGQLPPVNVLEIQQSALVNMDIQLNRVSLSNNTVKMQITASTSKTLKNPTLTVFAENGKNKTVLKKVKLGQLKSGKTKKVSYNLNLKDGKNYKVTAYLTDGENEVQAKNSINATDLKRYLFLEKVSMDIK
ncbi:hypothetical protein ACQKND_16115 [Viridibacillus arvi]|uniref:hypothetical protein n=1 Tax=Viridibacillus arvi TaxID=263475 RepID=UPI003D00CF24